VDSAERRQAVWQANALPGSYQLIAKNAQHQLFSSSLDELPGPNEGGRARPQYDSAGSGGGQGPGAGGAPGGKGGEGGKRRPRPDTMGHGQGSPNWFDAQQMANVQTVSTAFLDVTLRHSTPAKA
jgi:hypothetical protein